MKDFDEWNKLKKEIHSRKLINIKTGSVWLCNFGLNVGFEIDGKDRKFIRPALVLLGFGKGGGIVLPLTTTEKKSKFIIHIKDKSKVNITQVRYLDSRRFYRPIYFIEKRKQERIIECFKKLF